MHLFHIMKTDSSDYQATIMTEKHRKYHNTSPDDACITPLCIISAE